MTSVPRALAMRADFWRSASSRAVLAACSAARRVAGSSVSVFLRSWACFSAKALASWACFSASSVCCWSLMRSSSALLLELVKSQAPIAIIAMTAAMAPMPAGVLMKGGFAAGTVVGVWLYETADGLLGAGLAAGRGAVAVLGVGAGILAVETGAGLMVAAGLGAGAGAAGFADAGGAAGVAGLTGAAGAGAAAAV